MGQRHFKVHPPKDDSPLFFVLTNTRGMPVECAANLMQEVCHDLKLALEELREQNINPILVRQLDATLPGQYPGHYPVKLNVILEELGLLMLISWYQLF
jgi:uncharacterized protein YgbK (DUF1537 family)